MEKETENKLTDVFWEYHPIIYEMMDNDIIDDIEIDIIEEENNELTFYF